MIYPVGVHIERHPSGALLDVICDVNTPDPVLICCTRDVALILRAELEKALHV